MPNEEIKGREYEGNGLSLGSGSAPHVHAEQPQPSQPEELVHDVRITRASNGFIVRVGCTRFVSTSWDEVAKELGDYWRDPVGTVTRFRRAGLIS